MLVELKQGTIRGLDAGDGSIAFRGVPFAQPPAGEGRFRPPLPPRPWSGVRDATHFGPACPQEPIFPGLPIPPSVWDLRAAMTEDCLYLNVWVPDLEASGRPVLVWIHGGSYVQGAGSQAWFDGGALARALDAVVVTINYRVGVFGWLRTPGAASRPDAPQGNFGLRDQLAALNWVQANAAAFGGDPERVTIAGQSAGGKSVIALLGVPAAAALFDRVITMSGGFHADAPARAEKMGSMVLSALGLDDAADPRLWELEQTSVLSAGTAAFANTSTNVRWPGSRFGPILDDITMTQHPLEAVEQGALDGKAILVATTAEETRLVPLSATQAAKVDSDLAGAVVDLIGVGAEEAAALVERARERPGGGDERDQFHAIEAERLYVAPSNELAAAAARRGNPSYRLVCDWRGPDPAVAACHGIDIALLFATHRLPGMERFNGSGAGLEVVVDRFQRAVRSFVHGHPPRFDDEPWPRFDPDEQRAALLTSAGTGDLPLATMGEEA